MITNPRTRVYTRAPVSSMMFRASSTTKAMSPMNSRFFSISAMLCLPSANMGRTMRPMNEDRKSAKNAPTTSTRTPTNSLGR
ncbi:MAG: hypothetical protein A4E30_01445 [Methanomassiliicoccales archaeon PtaB.Bin215]|nr:MAG: hypothetical protein A4E30_01445 [Methanomassiliicoccales archaeon PtaB.Bin215]